MDRFLDELEENKYCRILILQGDKGVFSTGMDFESVIPSSEKSTMNGKNIYAEEFCEMYMKILNRLSLSSKIIISFVDGIATAGGVGLAAASDFVIATPRATFQLSELLWGLLPSMVVPFLIRRIGFQKAYSITISTLAVDADRALQWGLADEISDSPYNFAKQLMNRISKIEECNIVRAKHYFKKMWFVTEEMEQHAISQTQNLLNDKKIVQDLHNYIRYGQFPWETSE